ncbi:MAG: TetR/AcrR family transcriptional regulator [Pseudomonadota bacterium]
MAAADDPARRQRARNARPKIERAALKLFVSKSVDGATTREIAEEAGVSEGALYRHYPGKDDLALTLFMATHNRLGRIMQEAWMAGEGVEDRVRRVVTAYCELADEDWLLFSFHLLSLNKYLPHDVRRQDDPVSITESMIAGLIEAGEIPPGDPAILSGMALGVMMQSGQNKAYNRFDTPMADHIDTFTRAIVAILKQR